MTFPVIFTSSLRIISLLVLAGLLHACSAAKLAYNQAPTLAYLYLDGYLDFNDAQSLQVKAELTKFQAWHRQTQLAGYIDLLQKIQQKLPQDMTASQACEVFADVRQKALVMADYAQTATASVAGTFTQQQLDAMQRKFGKTNATWREDYLDGSAKDMLEKRQKSAIKRSDMLYGSVNDKQRSLMTQQIEKSSFSAAQNYAERQRRQKDILQTVSKVMANPQDPAINQQDMRNLLTRSITSPNAAHRSYVEQVTQDGCASFAELHNTTTPDQRKKAVQVLAGYEQDFKSLLAQK
ncbi:MAG: hypothetical protein HQ446_09465 [Polaromonas sp.]|nr:hypothetical protein [Polaromonas sp.]